MEFKTKQEREAAGITKEWLMDHYFNKGLNCVDIGKIVNRDPKSVWSWLVGYGITLRKRGADSSPGTFIKGHKKGIGRIHTTETKDKIRQARINDGHVPYLKDGKHWLKGMKGAIHPTWKGGITPERQSVYSSPEWCEAVKVVWKRDDATCQRCKKRQNEMRDIKFHIHHIESFMVREKRTDPDNLVLLCPTCHRYVHSKKNVTKLFIK